jgi:hypothetical protein
MTDSGGIDQICLILTELAAKSGQNPGGKNRQICSS